MRFSKVLFRVAGITSILILLPFFFLYKQIGVSDPPAITHPEYFYGFLVVGLAFDVCFLVIGNDPVRLRPAMIPAAVEKLGYGLASLVLFLSGQTAWQQMAFASQDILFGILFLVAYRMVGREQKSIRTVAGAAAV